MVNDLTLIGRLGADPEMTHTPSGDPVASARLATSEVWYDKATGEKKEATEWHRLELWGKNAENLTAYAHKGSLIYIKGMVKTRKWQDKSGNDRWTTFVKVWSFKFLEKKQESGTQNPQNSYHPPMEDEDLPF